VTVDVRRCVSLDDFRDATAAIGAYFAGRLSEEDATRFTQTLPVERMHMASIGGEVVGGAGAFPFEVSVPGGGSVRAAGVTVVGVLPTHRRRGVLRALMRAQLDDVHERGEPLAMLWASEETIYGRFGYGVAGWMGEVAVERVWAQYARSFERRGTARLVDADEAAELFPVVYAAARRARAGMHSRTDAWWRLRTLRTREEDKGNPKRFAVVEADGAPVAYAIWRRTPGWDAGMTTAKLEVLEAIGAEPWALVEMWRFLLDFDWTDTIVGWLLPPDHPLFLLLASLRRLRYRMWDSVWLRLVDVGEALSRRAYASSAPLVLELRDEFCPWNEGRWKIEAGEVARTTERADVALDVDALASVYLGGVTFARLRDGLRLEELRQGGVERADELFACALLPWCPEIF
jgi:predicted acetyltransferase